MRFKRTASSILAFIATGVISGGTADGQVATGAPITISPSSANVLNLLAPYLNLNATSIGQATLSTNLSQAIAVNNVASLALQQLGESDENLLGSGNGTTLRTQAQGYAATATFGVAANLGGGLPTQALPAGSTVVPTQAVGGLGVVLGGAYAKGVNASTTTAGPLNNVATLLNNAYTNFTSVNLGVAKNYFANGGANNTQTTVNGVTTNTTNPAVAPAGYTLPTANGLPNTTNSVYDLAAGVTNTQAGQDVFGSSRPDQVAASKINSFDPTALSGLTTNPSFPSGHTTYAYTDSILLAMLVPQEYQSMLYRGSAYANSRIVVGVHYPIDIIGSRALASYDLAQTFTNPLYLNNATTTGTAINLPANFTAASAQLTPYLTSASAAAGCGATIAACAASAANTANDPYVVNATNAATYTSNLTYGLPTLTLAQAPQEAAPAGGPDASILLAPVYGGSTSAAATLASNGGTNGSLSTATINQILVNTETTALAAFYGTSLSYWTRIDLAAAAGYFGNVVGTLSLAKTDVVNVPVTIASGGVLDANGTVNGAATVTSAGTLSGSGVINGAVAVNAGGTLAPGSLAAQTALASGTAGVAGTSLAVNGAIAFAPGSTLAIFASPTQTTSATASGAATLTGAAVNVTLPTSGAFVTSKNNLILAAAGGLNGTFAGVTTNLLFATPTLSYDPNTNVFLSFGTPNFGLVATTSNQAAVAGALNRGAAVNTAAPVVAALEFSSAAQAGQVRAVLDTLSGEGITATQNLAHREAGMFTSAIFDQTTFYGSDRGAGNQIVLTEPRPGGGFQALTPATGDSDTLKVQPIRELADLPASRPQFIEAAPLAPQRTWRAWGTGFGAEEDVRSNAAIGFAAQQTSIVGGAVGVDYQALPNMLFGLAAGGSDGSFNVSARATSGSTSGGHIAGYTFANFGPFYGAASLSGSFYQNRTTRNVAGFGGLASETEKGNFNSREIRTRLETGRSFGAPLGTGTTVTPFVALEIASLRSDGFTEQAIAGPGLFALNVSGQSAADVPAFVGLRFTNVTTLGNGLVVKPVLQLAYMHEFAPYRQLSASINSLPGSVFLVDGARPARDAVQVKAGGEIVVGPRTAIFANFDGEFAHANQLYGGKGGIKVLF